MPLPLKTRRWAPDDALTAPTPRSGHARSRLFVTFLFFFHLSQYRSIVLLPMRWCLGRRALREFSRQLCGQRIPRLSVMLAAVLCAAAICRLTISPHRISISHTVVPDSVLDTQRTPLNIPAESGSEKHTPRPGRENACIIILCRYVLASLSRL